MKRASKLQLAEYCGVAGVADDGVTTIAALRGNAFHACNAVRHRPDELRFRREREDALTALAAHDPDAADEITAAVERLAATWTPPEGARFEAEIGLSRDGTAVPYGHDLAITQGTADCVWEDDAEVVVLDFKSGARAAFNVPFPRDNLQLAAYGLGFADALGKTRMRLGIYLAAEDRWLWDLIDLDSAEGTRLWERVRAAALRDPDVAVVGPHCDDCYHRLRCHAWTLPALSTVERVTSLAPLGGNGDIVEPRKLMRLLQACKAMEEIADAGKAYLRAYVERHGPIVAGGMQWGPISVKGRESTSVKALKESGLYDRAVAVGAVKQGATTQQYRWTKARQGA